MLVKTLVPREEDDDEISDGVQCYVPGIVQVVPLRKAPATKCYTILRYNGKKVWETFICELAGSGWLRFSSWFRDCSHRLANGVRIQVVTGN